MAFSRIAVLSALISALTPFSAFSAEDKPVAVYLCRYENAELSRTFRARRIGERLVRISEALIPHREGSLRVRFVPGRDPDMLEPSAEWTPRRGYLTITLPVVSFDRWSEEPRVLRMLGSWIFLARMGHTGGASDIISSHWIIRAAARKVQREIDPVRMPFARPFPAAYVFASEGIYPDISAAVADLPSDLPPALDELCGEYAEILFDACARRGFFRKGLADVLLTSASSTGPGNSWNAFLHEAGPMLDPVAGSDSAPLSDEARLRSWFRESAERGLLSFCEPVTAEYFEALYWKIAKCSYLLPSGKSDSCRLSELPDRVSQMADPDTIAKDLCEQLFSLEENAPAPLRKRLSDLREALTARPLSTPENAERLRAAERALLLETAHLDRVERFLSDAQRRHVNPGARIARTVASLQALDELEKISPAAERMLDSWDVFQ